jgi:hypothetical protein
MPKELTHWILADRALALLSSDSRLRRLIQINHDIYLAGAVLPDTLLHPFRSPHAATALALAKTFHDTSGNSFIPLIQAEQHFPDDIPPAILACLLGVITHMQADIVFHPFVFALTGTAEIGRHYQIETAIDVHFLQRGSRPKVLHVADLVSPSTRSNIVETCALLFDPDNRLPRASLEQALKQHCYFQKMYDRTFLKVAVRLAALLAGAPYTEHRQLFYPLARERTARFIEEAVEWRHPVSGELRQTTIEDLAEEAVQRITTLFNLIEAQGSLTDILSNHPGENLLTGMHDACLGAMAFQKDA